MAAGSIFASLLGIVPLTVWAEDVTDVHKVKLELRIAGVGRNGCDIEIKPGHAGCKFQVIRHHLAGDRGWGQLQLVLDDVQTRSPDRDCAFAITIREPGQADRTVHRGLRLTPPKLGQTTPTDELTCYLSSPSMLARAEKTRRPR
jgi:hypothetical protein